MKTITQTTYSPSYKAPIQFDLLRRFIDWCKSQEKNRFGWLALSLATHGCIITPLVVFFITVTGNDFTLWIAAMLAMGVTLIVNLAAQPTKITIPVFFLSIVVDIAIIAACIVQSVAY
ncbi:MAG TPA: hypothetical protein VFP87_08505 [Chitinophagaceae bacterium]|nr:hypothetical protein [Chitinophagaceae bacterium]